MVILPGAAAVQLASSAAVASTLQNGPAAAIENSRDLARLADEFAGMADVQQVHQSVVVRVPNHRLLTPDSRRLTEEGKALVAKMAADLSRYPETAIYLRKYAGATPDSRLAAMQELFVIRAALRDAGIDVSRINTVITDRPAVETAENAPAEAQQFVEVRLLPRT